MNVEEIIKKHLEENDFDGLYNEEFRCACKIDNLLACGDFVNGTIDIEDIKNCKAGNFVSEDKEFDFKIGELETEDYRL